jgi:hypothetical protein
LLLATFIIMIAYIFVITLWALHIIAYCHTYVLLELRVWAFMTWLIILLYIFFAIWSTIYLVLFR